MSLMGCNIIYYEANDPMVIDDENVMKGTMIKNRYQITIEVKKTVVLTSINLFLLVYVLLCLRF